VNYSGTMWKPQILFGWFLDLYKLD